MTARRLPAWRYNVRRAIALALLAATVIGAVNVLGFSLCDGPTCETMP